jgi:hypothetical protein
MHDQGSSSRRTAPDSSIRNSPRGTDSSMDPGRTRGGATLDEEALMTLRKAHSGDGRGDDHPRRMKDGRAPMDGHAGARGGRERGRERRQERPGRFHVSPRLDELGRFDRWDRRRGRPARARWTRARLGMPRGGRKGGLGRLILTQEQGIDQAGEIILDRLRDRVMRATGTHLSRGEEAASQEREERSDRQANHFPGRKCLHQTPHRVLEDPFTVPGHDHRTEVISIRL